MRIGELAKRTGLAVSRIRFYEARGLLAEAPRSEGGYRDYPPAAEQLLEMIAGIQRAGFSLDEIAAVLPSAGMNADDQAAIVARLKKKAEGMAAMAQELLDNRARLLDIVAYMESRPAGQDCEGKHEVILAAIRETGTAGRGSSI